MVSIFMDDFHLHINDILCSDSTGDGVYVPMINNNGETVYITEELRKKLEKEWETWHWTPWLRTRTEIMENLVREVDCIGSDSVDSFPDGIFTGE